MVGVAQYLVARRSDEDETDFGASVALYDPGTLDAAALQRGERITARGHPAYYVADFPAGQVRHLGEPGMVEARLPVVGWLDPSGGWILVYDNRDRDSLVRVAQDVRVGTARQVKTPFRLGHVPAGLPGAASVTSDSIPAQSNSVTGFGDVGTPTLVDLRNAGITPTLAMHIQVVPRDEYVNSHTRALGPATKIAGLDTWYITTQDKGMRPPERGSILVVNARNCQASIIVQDRNQIPYAEMTRLVEQATFADCQNPATWTPPLP